MSDIRYEELVEKALIGVVRDALKLGAAQGLDQTNHFYIGFKTAHPDVELSDRLLKAYPDEMTIVLQHEYSDLVVDEDAFSVTLSFGDVPEQITVPFAAIFSFADPYAQFALSFKPSFEKKKKPEKKKSAPVAAADESKAENVISLSAFRKKK